MKKKSTILKRIYPTLNPVDRQKQIGKAVLWNLFPIPIGDIVELFKGHFQSLWSKPKTDDWIEVDGYSIKVGGKSVSLSQEYIIEEVDDLRIYFTEYPRMEGDMDMDERQFKNQISRFTFSYRGDEHEIFFEGRKKNILKMMDHLYKSSVKFKEYYNQRRVFIGKTPTYKQIQVIKEKYNLDW